MPHCNDPDSKHDRIIAVMGATGTGKSTFINLVTEDEKIIIGDDPESKTDSINVSCYYNSNAHLSTKLVDTPGFDDSRDGHSDVNILNQIANFLLKDGGKKLNGIIYMHRISDPRTGGMAKKNLRMFKELCGQKTLANVLIVTTNWGRVGEEEGKRREKALAAGFFKPLIDDGACMARHDNTVEGAYSILSPLLYKDGVTTKIQDELGSGTTLAETSAGAVVDANIRAAEARQKKKLQSLKEQLEKAAIAKDEKLQKELELERREVEAKLGNMDMERRKLEETIEKQRQKIQAQLAQLEKAKEEADRKATEMEAAQKQMEDLAAEQRRKIEEELAKVREEAEIREVDMKAAAERERQKQNQKIAADLAKEEEAANRKAREIELAQQTLQADIAEHQKKVAEQLAETKKNAQQREAAMATATEKERREHRQLIDAQLAKAKEEADRKSREMAAMQTNLSNAAAQQQATSQQELARVKEAARRDREAADRGHQKQKEEAAALFVKQRADADRKLVAMMAEAERKRRAVEAQLADAKREAQRKKQELADAQAKSNRGLIRTIFSWFW